jgi:hypothetical protein
MCNRLISATNGAMNDRIHFLEVRSWTRARFVALLLFGCISLLSLRPLIAQDDSEGTLNREYPLKALFLYNFAGYIEWPANTFANEQTPFTIGVLGNASIDETLNQIAAAKQINGRKIAIVHFVSVNDLKPCQILFIPRSVPAPQQNQAIEAMKNRPVLIVGESDGFAAAGGDVNFFVQANKIRFEINVAAIKQQQLKASSKLLAMAKIVDQDSTRR